MKIKLTVFLPAITLFASSSELISQLTSNSQEYTSVLRPGPAGSWDENIRERGWFMFENGVYHAWYGGWRGEYNHNVPRLVKLGYAFSTDGIHWQKHPGNPIYDQTWIEDVCVVKDGSTYYMFAEDEYTGGGDNVHIVLYTSTDRINWVKYGTVLEREGNGWEYEEAATPTVWKEGNTWYMLYEGIGRSTAGQIGLATSANGKNWTRYSNNPVLANPFGRNRDIAFDSIIKIDGVYHAYGHYRNDREKWVGGVFLSSNLISWQADSDNPIAYNSPVIIHNGSTWLLYGLGSNGRAPYSLSIGGQANNGRNAKLIHDAYVSSSARSTIYGSAVALQARKSRSENTHAYLKFEVKGINGQVKSATLRLRVTDASNSGGEVYLVSNKYKGRSSQWKQSGINWNNAPGLNGPALSSAGAVRAGEWVEFDVTSAIHADGIYSFGLQNASSDAVLFSSKEGAKKPELIIDTEGIARSAAQENDIIEVNEFASPPQAFALHQNHPNPFNPRTLIEYSLPEPGDVRLSIFDVLGREVVVLVTGWQTAGRHEIMWDSRDGHDQRVGSGIYIYQLRAGELSASRRMLLIQ